MRKHKGPKIKRQRIRFATDFPTFQLTSELPRPFNTRASYLHSPQPLMHTQHMVALAATQHSHTVTQQHSTAQHNIPGSTTNSSTVAATAATAILPGDAVGLRDTSPLQSPVQQRAAYALRLSDLGLEALLDLLIDARHTDEAGGSDLCQRLAQRALGGRQRSVTFFIKTL